MMTMMMDDDGSGVGGGYAWEYTSTKQAWIPKSRSQITNMKRRKDLYWSHDDVIKWKHFPRYWPFVRGIHRSRWIPRTKASDAEL